MATVLKCLASTVSARLRCAHHFAPQRLITVSFGIPICAEMSRQLNPCLRSFKWGPSNADTQSLRCPLPGHWLRTKLPQGMSEDDYRIFKAWAGNPDLTNRLDLNPGRIQMSMCDRQVYRVEMKNWKPPMTIGEAPHIRPRMFIELFIGLILLACAAWIQREDRRRGTRYRRRGIEANPGASANFLKGWNGNRRDLISGWKVGNPG